MQVSLTSSVGSIVRVWRANGWFHAERLRPTPSSVQVCLPSDLFEVIAELAGLDLENSQQTAEAMRLAALAIEQIKHADLS